MEATYGRSIWSTAAFNGFDLPNVSICYILTWLRCLWATAELQNSWLCGPSFQLGNPKFLPGTSTAGTNYYNTINSSYRQLLHHRYRILFCFWLFAVSDLEQMTLGRSVWTAESLPAAVHKSMPEVLQSS